MLSHPVVSDSYDPVDCSPPCTFVHGDSLSKNAEVGCHALLQGILQIQGLNPGLLLCRQILYHLSYQGSPLPDSVQFSSVTQLCLTLCDPMNHSMPGLPVHHQFPEFT